MTGLMSAGIASISASVMFILAGCYVRHKEHNWQGFTVFTIISLTFLGMGISFILE